MSKTILVFTCEEQMEMGFVEIRLRQSFFGTHIGPMPLEPLQVNLFVQSSR
jgi:hypothetical protein